jgi:hypothetical protein
MNAGAPASEHVSSSEKAQALCLGLLRAGTTFQLCPTWAARLSL